MEIRIKTATEFRDAHVTIEIRADQDEVQSVTNVLDQAERAGKVPALEAQILELKDDLASVRGRVDGQVARIRELVAERDALLLKVQGYNHDRHTEKQRADENRGWAERTEALLENVTTERDALRLQVENSTQSRQLTGTGQKALTELKGQLVRIQDKVWRGTLDFAMNHRGAPEEIPIETVGDLANTVSAVRSIVGQP